MNKTIQTFCIIGTLTVPFIGWAQNFGYFASFFADTKEILGLLFPLLIASALVVFIWGLVSFILNSGSDDAYKEAKQKMVWGIIALFVMVAVWGLVALVQELTGINATNAPTPPEVLTMNV